MVGGELAQVIWSNQGVRSPFIVDAFGKSYKVMFRTIYDYGKVLKVDWTKLDFKLLVVPPWSPWIKPSKETLETIPI